METKIDELEDIFSFPRGQLHLMRSWEHAEEACSQRYGNRASFADSSTMDLQLDLSPASLRSCRPSVLLDERMKSRYPSERITERRNSHYSSPTSSRFAAKIKIKNKRPDFTG